MNPQKLSEVENNPDKRAAGAQSILVQGSAPQLDSLERALIASIAALSILAALLFLITALRRWHYPYELEELEGNMFLATLRVFRGEPLYVRPSLAFIPYMYPPGYYYLTAALGHVMGMSIATLRMTSILSTLGTFAVIFLLVWTETKRMVPALAGMGIYAGCYALCGGWFDLGRVDSLFLFVVALAIYSTRHLNPILTAILWVLAFEIKQSILPAAFVILCSLWPERRRLVPAMSTFIAGVAGSVLYLNHVTQGWYYFYVFTVPGANADLKARTAALFWSLDIVRPLGLVLMVILTACLITPPSLRNPATRFYVACCSLIPLFWWIRTHSGSTMNAVMPIYLLLAILFGISFGRLLVVWAGADKLDRPAAVLLLIAVLIAELAGLYNPGDFVPSLETRQSLDRVVADIRVLPGQTYIAQHPYYGWLAGKSTSADLVAIHDALRVNRSDVQDPLRQDLRLAVEDHRYQEFVIETPSSTEDIDALLKQHVDWAALYSDMRELPGVPLRTHPAWLIEAKPAR